MNNVLEERRHRTIHRKLAKKQYDEIMELSLNKLTLSPNENDEYSVRLIDEGAIVDAYGSIDVYIMKGVIDKYIEQLPDDYVGAIDLGHRPFAEFPFFLGEWRKSDLSVVDIGDGRKGLDITVRLDEDSAFVKELRRSSRVYDYDLGVSATFYYTLDMDATREFGFPMIDSIDIKQFAIVGECGNVNSDGLNLSGGSEDMAALKKLFGLEDEPKTETEAAVSDPDTEADIMQLETVEPESGSEPEPETEGPEKEALDVESVLKEAAETIRSLEAAITEKEKEITALSEKVEALEMKVAEHEQGDREFLDNLKELSLALNPNVETKEEEVIENESRYAGNGGIGEL